MNHRAVHENQSLLGHRGGLAIAIGNRGIREIKRVQLIVTSTPDHREIH